MSMDYEQILSDIVRPLADSLGLVLWGIEILGSTRPLVRIYVDLPADAGGADPSTHADSVRASIAGLESDELDEPIDDQDVSSTGAPMNVSSSTKAKASRSQKPARPPLPTGVGIGQCTHLSRLLSLALDVEAPFAAEWVLEVSSPGFARPFFALEQLPSYIGEAVEVVLASAMDEWPLRKKFSGTLKAVGDETLSLALPEGTYSDIGSNVAEIPWRHVRKMHLVHAFKAVDKKAGSLKLLQQASQK